MGLEEWDGGAWARVGGGVMLTLEQWQIGFLDQADDWQRVLANVTCFFVLDVTGCCVVCICGSMKPTIHGISGLMVVAVAREREGEERWDRWRSKSTDGNQV